MRAGCGREGARDDENARRGEQPDAAGARQSRKPGTASSHRAIRFEQDDYAQPEHDERHE
jgi:hypothetical protein